MTNVGEYWPMPDCGKPLFANIGHFRVAGSRCEVHRAGLWCGGDCVLQCAVFIAACGHREGQRSRLGEPRAETAKLKPFTAFREG